GRGLIKGAVAGYQRRVAFVGFVAEQFRPGEGVDTRRIFEADMTAIIGQQGGKLCAVAAGGFHADMAITEACQPGHELTASGWGVGEFFGFVFLIRQQDGNIKLEFGDVNADRYKFH
ncbi:MAG: hypothetical protein RSE94_23125, partial [Pseudomonas sp.]